MPTPTPARPQVLGTDELMAYLNKYDLELDSHFDGELQCACHPNGRDAARTHAHCPDTGLPPSVRLPIVPYLQACWAATPARRGPSLSTRRTRTYAGSWV